MKTIIFKPILLLVMIIGVAFVSINAGQTIDDGTIKIEVAVGFTIEDIIQDLHDNTVTVVSTNVTSSIYILQYSSKMVDDDFVKKYLQKHPGANVIYER
ncbi:MAG: hypothetical protein AB8G11_04285 [Saprospiraceae bacterium]